MEAIVAAVGKWVARRAGQEVRGALVGPAYERAWQRVVSEALRAGLVLALAGSVDRGHFADVLAERARERPDFPLDIDPECTLGQALRAGVVAPLAEEVPDVAAAGYLAELSVDPDGLAERLFQAIRDGVRRDALSGGPLQPLWAILQGEETREHIVRELRPPTARPTGRGAAVVSAQLRGLQAQAGWLQERGGPPIQDVYIELRLETSQLEPPIPGNPEASLMLGPTSKFVTISMDAALAREDHIVIVGAPGAGKSTVAAGVIRKLSEGLFAEPTPADERVPLFIQAANVRADDGGLDDMVAKAFARQFGHYFPSHGALRATLTDLQEEHGWTVVIDGMDEVMDARLRERLAHAVAHSAAEGRAHRFVITSRAPIEVLRHQGGFTQLTVARLSSEEVRIFASKWFQSLDAPNSRRRTEEFFQWLTAGGLTDSWNLDTPLIATLALTLYSASLARAAPAYTYDLYRDFVDYLFDRRQSTVRTWEKVRVDMSAFGPQGVRLADWLFENRRAIVSHAAERTLADDGTAGWYAKDLPPIDELAEEYVRSAGAPTAGIRQWEPYLADILADTGVFARSGPRLKFAHRTLAEFLAAPVAGPVPYQEWGYWHQEGNRSYLFWRIVEWSRTYDPDADALVEAILTRDPTPRRGALQPE